MQGSDLVAPSSQPNHVLLAYIADLELEVDRLRMQGHYIQHEARETLKRIVSLSDTGSASTDAAQSFGEIQSVARQLGAVLRDLREPPGGHPAHDQVVTIGLRPLIEQAFRWQQRLSNTPFFKLIIDLEQESIEWFPVRLRHIFDNLIANVMRVRELKDTDTSVTLAMRATAQNYEFRVSDSAHVIAPMTSINMNELFYRSVPGRAAGIGVGVSVAKLLAEQSGGDLFLVTDTANTPAVVVVLPRYDIDDFLE